MVEQGWTVKVEFVGRLDNGAEFSNSHLVGEPLEFTIGAGGMLPAFEEAVSSLQVGEEKTVRIPFEQAYGPYDDSLIERVPAALVPNAGDLPIGGYVVFETPEESLRVRVLKREGDWLYLDHNHELAGEDLTFDIKLVEAKPATQAI